MTVASRAIIRRLPEIVYTDTCGLSISVGQLVLIETEHGQEVARICEPERDYPTIPNIYKVLRPLTDSDRITLQQIAEKNKRALGIILEKIKDHELDMKLTCVQYTFDQSKIFIYYTAENRIDFRELIKDLGYILKCRIQMVQIGVRDETRMLGGLGLCGRIFCCHSFLKKFESITIDMAKEQDLQLNTAKLSGPCGRLLCCLGYEAETYREIRAKLPNIGEKVKTPAGPGIVKSISCLRQQVLVTIGEEDKIFSLSEISPL